MCVLDHQRDDLQDLQYHILIHCVIFVSLVEHTPEEKYLKQEISRHPLNRKLHGNAVASQLGSYRGQYIKRWFTRQFFLHLATHF